jgi:hypothetical protein
MTVARAVAGAVTAALAVHEFRSTIRFAALTTRAVLGFDKIRIVAVRDAIAVLISTSVSYSFNRHAKKICTFDQNALFMET